MRKIESASWESKIDAKRWSTF